MLGEERELRPRVGEVVERLLEMNEEYTSE